MEQHDHPSEELARIDDMTIQRSVFDELLPQDNPRVRYIAAAVAVVIAIVSFFVVAGFAGSPETYADIIASLDEKRDTVMGFITGSTAASAAITAAPGDIGTPIAEKLLDLSTDFAVVIGAIYLEKYMLTILGLAAFKVLVPVGCVLFSIAALITSRAGIRNILYQASLRLVLFGVVISLVVPASVHASNLIEATYESSMSSVIDFEEEPVVEEPVGNIPTEQKGFFEQLAEWFQHVPENVVNIASGVSEEIQSRFNYLVETLAVMIVTSCVIPILVLLFFMWLAKTILGVRIDVPMTAIAPRSIRRLRK